MQKEFLIPVNLASYLNQEFLTLLEYALLFNKKNQNMRQPLNHVSQYGLYRHKMAIK